MYLFREDMYNEWSWENGATDIICLSKNFKTIMKHLEQVLESYSKDNRINIDYYCTIKIQGIIYASSEQIIWDAIKEIGEDNFKKYVLGVK